MSGPWSVPITALRRSSGSRRHERREGRLPDLHVAGTVVPDDASVVVDVVLSSVLGGVEVGGTVRAPWRGECRRCLRPVHGEITSTVRELFRPIGGQAREPDEDTYGLGADFLDLQPLARDAILLELPLAPICQPRCRGLCSICGADRNEESCGCRPESGDPRWSALEALRPPSEARVVSEPEAGHPSVPPTST